MPLYRIAMMAAALLTGLSFAGPAAAQDLPPGEGRDVVQAACTSCHGVDVIVMRHRGADEWNDVVARMIGNGAALTDDEYTTVVHYLATTLGPEKAAPAKPKP
jgi:mono/diheme cytochrome c family protein